MTLDEKLAFLESLALEHPDVRLPSALSKMHVQETAERLKHEIASRGMFVRDYVETVAPPVRPLTIGRIIDDARTAWEKWRTGQ